MSAATYDAAMVRVYADEGGYTNDPVDPGGATNFGITIIDARKYWNPNATPADIRSMPKAKPAAVVAAAKKKGINISAAHVYVLRSTDKNKGGVKAAAKPTKKPAVIVAKHSGEGWIFDRAREEVKKHDSQQVEQQLRHAIAQLGLAKTHQILAQIVSALR